MLFTAAEITESTNHRTKLGGQTTYSRAQRKVIAAPAPNWCLEETHALILLIYAGVKFTKAWDQYLQHTLLWRSKGTSSGKWYQVAKEIASSDAYHGEKHWLLHGGRIGGETQLPSSELLIARAIAKLRQVRVMCLNTAPETAKFNNHDEYWKEVLRREEFGSDDDDEDEAYLQSEREAEECRRAKKARVEQVEETEANSSPPSLSSSSAPSTTSSGQGL